MMGLAEKLLHQYPDAQWSLNGEDYAGLIWFGPGTMPTKDQLAALDEPVSAVTVYKADIWRRCSDDDAAKLDAAIAAQPVRLRRLFDGAQFLRSDDELFGLMQAAVMQLLGPERAAVILAPSE